MVISSPAFSTIQEPGPTQDRKRLSIKRKKHVRHLTVIASSILFKLLASRLPVRPPCNCNNKGKAAAAGSAATSGVAASLVRAVAAVVVAAAVVVVAVAVVLVVRVAAAVVGAVTVAAPIALAVAAFAAAVVATGAAAVAAARDGKPDNDRWSAVNKTLWVQRSFQEATTKEVGMEEAE